jgi:aminopeptidase N
MEDASGLDLKVFFNQWLYSAGHPELKTTFLKKRSLIKITIEQVQMDNLFEVPLTIEIELSNGEKIIKELHLNSKTQSFNFTFDKKVKSWKIDPNVDLLFELKN